MSISLEKTKATKESYSQYPSIFDVPAEHRAAKVQFLFKITAQKIQLFDRKSSFAAVCRTIVQEA